MACTRHAIDVSQEIPPELGDTTENSGEKGVIRDFIGAAVSVVESALTLAAGGGTFSRFSSFLECCRFHQPGRGQGAAQKDHA